MDNTLKLKPTMSMYASMADFEAAMDSWLESNDDDVEDYYDSAGNCSPGGMFDAGGHPISERIADYADWLCDDMKYRD